MSLTPFQRRVLLRIERDGRAPPDVRVAASRRASVNEMVRAKWIERKWTRQVGGAWTAKYALTDLGHTKLHQGELKA